MKLYLSYHVKPPGLSAAIQTFTKMGFEVTASDKSKNAEKADIIGFILPQIKFSYYLTDLSKERIDLIQEAKSTGKTLLIVYRNAKGEWNLYDSVIENSLIKGVAGTSDKNAALAKKEPKAIEGWESYEGKIEYKTLPDGLPCDADIIKAYLASAPSPMEYTYHKAQEEKRTFSEMAIMQQKTRVRRLLLL